MIEDVLQAQPQTQKLVEKKSARSAEFEKYLKESTQNLEGLASKTTQEVAKPAQTKGSKAQKPAQAIAESSENKDQAPKKSVPKNVPSATELLATSLAPEALKVKDPLAPATAPKDTPLTQALKAAQDQGTKSAQEKQTLQNQATNIAPKPIPAINPEELKSLDDVRTLAEDQGLNPTKVTALEQEEVLPKPKRTPESAKQKIQYEAENAEDRVAIINRGTKKPKNITSKISNIYEEGKAEQSGATLGSMLGLKDLPRQA